MTKFANEFLKGQRDCKDGKPCKDKGEAYQKGYAAQYGLEQMNDAQTRLERRAL